jgi:hypothetical protein
MMPEGVQSNGDEQGHKHVHWAALDIQTEALQERHTHGESSQVHRGGHGRHRPGDMHKEEAGQSAAEGEGGSRCASGPQTSIPYSRTGRRTEWIMRFFTATLMRGDTSTGRQV